MRIKILLSVIWLYSLYFLLSAFVFWQSIDGINTSFCNDWIFTENLTFSTNSAKLNEICTKFTNNTDEDISIKIWFPDGAITNDDKKNKACKWEWNIENFWKYVIQKNKNLTIPAQKSIIEKSYIRFPAWFSWIVRWCQTLFLDKQKSNLNDSVNVVVRKTNYIDILVWWNFKREISIKDFSKTNNLSINKKINTIFNLDSSLSLQLNFVNNWDIDEFFSWSWTISNKFWFSKDFEIEKVKLLSNSTEVLTIPIWRLPFYWGFFNIQINWSLEPKIDFNKESLDDRLKKEIEIKENTIITVIPRNIIIWIIILIIMFFTIKHYKKKKKQLELIKLS